MPPPPRGEKQSRESDGVEAYPWPNNILVQPLVEVECSNVPSCMPSTYGANSAIMKRGLEGKLESSESSDKIRMPSTAGVVWAKE